MEQYDTIVVGGGPTGLTCAWYAAKKGEKVLVVESAEQIGGCHRVDRSILSDGEILFGEHGPRIYSTSYVCFQKLLKDMGLSFGEFFAPYEFGISTIGAKNAAELNFWEFGVMTMEFLIGGSEDMSVADFARMKYFSSSTIDYLDRLCRLTDGAGADRYTVRQFLNLIDQQSLYTLMQPRVANDRGLFRRWREKLESVGVKIWTTSHVTGLVVDDIERKIRGVTVLRRYANGERDVSNNNIRVDAQKVLMCIPPRSLQRLLGSKLLRKYFAIDKEWVKNTMYEKYINVTFMWKEDVLAKVPRVWGFPESKWGVAFIVLTDTMRGENFGTIISAATTKSDEVPPEIGKKKLVEEIFAQVKLAYPNLPEYDYYTLNTGKADFAYVAAANTEPMDTRSYVRGLFAIGPHNNNSEYAFTSLESAVSNAMHFYGIQRPRLWRLRQILLILFAVLVGAIVGYKAKNQR